MPRPVAMQIGRYEVLAELGQGTMGIVYRARDPQLERVVAIKALHAVVAGGGPPREERRRRFAQEAAAAGRLNHPNVVAVYDVLEIADVSYIVMEYVEGTTLAELIRTEAPLSPERATQLLRPVCWALEYAHARGVVHRDVKPGNILVADSGDVKLGDFGIARLAGHTATQTGTMLGTPAYMAPEQVQGRGADRRSDLFALGVVLYEALAGGPPFQGDDVATILYQIAHTDPPPASSRNSSISPALDATLARALAKNPAKRYATGAALADALAEALLPPSGATRSARHRLRTPWRLAATRRAVALGSAGLLATGLGSWAIGSRVPSHERGAARPEPERGASEAPPAESPTPRSIERGQAVTTAAALPGEAAPPAPNAASLEPGTIKIATNPSVDVWLDGRYQGRTTAQPLVIAEVRAGERQITLRRGSREHDLRRTLRAGATVSLHYDFPDASPTESKETPPATVATALGALGPSQTDARAARPTAAAATLGALRSASPSGGAVCLSVNAIPYARVFVDGHDAGETPKGCLRVSVGEHRIQFEASGERSPERVVQVTEAHTASNGARVSYDFRGRRFLE